MKNLFEAIRANTFIKIETIQAEKIKNKKPALYKKHIREINGLYYARGTQLNALNQIN